MTGESRVVTDMIYSHETKTDRPTHVVHRTVLSRSCASVTKASQNTTNEGLSPVVDNMGIRKNSSS